jgi:hypothetical protein
VKKRYHGYTVHRKGLSIAVQTAILIVVTASLTALAFALWRPWEAGQQALAGAVSETMTSMHEILLRREGSVTPQFALHVYPYREKHHLEVEWNGKKMSIPVTVSTIEYRGPKTRLPGVYYLEKGEVDVLGGYIVGGKINYTTTGVDVVSYVEYRDKEMRYVVKSIPYVNMAVDRIYHDVVINVMLRFVFITPYPPSFTSREYVQAIEEGHVIGAGKMVTLRHNGTYQYYMQQPESVNGGTLRLYFDGQPVTKPSGERLEFSTQEKTIVRVFVDVVVLNIWGR